MQEKQARDQDHDQQKSTKVSVIYLNYSASLGGGNWFPGLWQQHNNAYISNDSQKCSYPPTIASQIRL